MKFWLKIYKSIKLCVANSYVLVKSRSREQKPRKTTARRVAAIVRMLKYYLFKSSREVPADINQSLG